MIDSKKLAGAIMDMAERDRGLVRSLLEELIDEHQALAAVVGPDMTASDVARRRKVYGVSPGTAAMEEVRDFIEVLEKSAFEGKDVGRVKAAPAMEAIEAFRAASKDCREATITFPEGTDIIREANQKFNSDVTAAIQHRLDEGYKWSDILVEWRPEHTDIIVAKHNLLCRVMKPTFITKCKV